MTETFQFLDPGELIDGDLQLVLKEKHPAFPDQGFVPTYVFDMVRTGTACHMGNISLRVGNTDRVVLYAGHIGYGVDSEYRGHHYAARACRLIMPLARLHGLNTLWITTNPDNMPSRRTCEMIGCEMVEIVDIPADMDMYAKGERQKCRYRLGIS